VTSSSKRKLSVVGDEPTGESESDSATQHVAEAASYEIAKGVWQNRLVWLLAALLLAVSAYLIAQMQHVRDLDLRVQTLTVELSGAQKDVEAQRQHFRAVQGEVGAVQAAAIELERRMAELGELAGRDPLAARLAASLEPR